MQANTLQCLESVLKIIADTTPFTEETLEKNLRATADQMGIKAAALIHPTRLALTGGTNSPGIFEVMCILGKECCTERIEQAMEYVQRLSDN